MDSKRFWTIWGISVLAVVAVISLPYIVNFIGQYSDSPSDWAKTATYFGGMLGPAFSLLAFLAILWTLQHQKIQSRLEELQRLIASESADLQKLLSDEPRYIDTESIPFLRTDIHEAQMDDRKDFLTGFGGMALWKLAMVGEDELFEDQTFKAAKNGLRKDAGLVLIRVRSLVKVLKMYAEAGGHHDVISFYKGKFQYLVCCIYTLGLVGTEFDSVKDFFDPEGIRSSFQ